MKLSEELKTKSLDETLTEHNLTLAEAFQLSLKKQPTETITEKYIRKLRKGYCIRKSVKGKIVNFGCYQSLEDAVTVRDCLIKDGWRQYRLKKICEKLNIEMIQ